VQGAVPGHEQIAGHEFVLFAAAADHDLHAPVIAPTTTHSHTRDRHACARASQEYDPGEDERHRSPSPSRAVATLAVAILVSGAVAGRREFGDLFVGKETEDQVRRKGGLLQRETVRGSRHDGESPVRGHSNRRGCRVQPHR
jgi:hypothetical protein